MIDSPSDFSATPNTLILHEIVLFFVSESAFTNFSQLFLLILISNEFVSTAVISNPLA